MNQYKLSVLNLAVVSAFITSPAGAADMSFTEAVTGGQVYGDFLLRYERVDQDNLLDHGNALTFRSRLGYNTAAFSNFSGTLEFEDVRTVAGQDNYDLPPPARPANYTVKGNSVIADPEVTELDQGYVKYAVESFSAKLGRQVLTYDNHRFIGDVGWRQDRQTFDALSLKYMPLESLTLNYAYLDQRNRIFAERADVNAKDHLFNVSYKTGVGTVVAYGYLLEMDSGADNALDTYGLSFNGTQQLDATKILYAAEYANQNYELGANEADADYMMLEAGAVVAGVTAKLGYEVLGSDSGKYGFATPLATLHKFNGWADQFLATPAQGLTDLYVSVSGTLAEGQWMLVYHDFAADDSSPTVDDLGSELDLSYGKKFGKNYSAGIKYAAYSAGDAAAGKVDTDIAWLWVGVSF